MALEMIAVIAVGTLVFLRYAPSLLEYSVPYGLGVFVTVLDFVSWSVGRFSRVVLLSIVLFSFTGITALNIYLFGVTSDLPDLDPVINYRPKQIGYFYDGSGGKLMPIAELYRAPVSYDELPVVVRQAVIASEDKRYYGRLHWGVDVIAWPRVLRMNLAGHTQGGSTITQQLTRNLLLADMLADERGDELVVDNFFTRQMSHQYGTFWTNKVSRKTIEGKYSLYLERALTDYYEQGESYVGVMDFLSDGPRQRARLKMKDHVLACYANDVYLGNGVYGFPYGARYYFGKSIRDLEVHEAALLASFIPFPGPYASIPADPDKRRVKFVGMRERRNAVLRRMMRNSFISEKNMHIAMREPINIAKPRGGSKTIAPAAVHKALQEVKELGIPHSLITSGFAHPHLTINPEIQEAVNRGVEVGMENFAKRWPEEELPQYAVIVLENATGAILGISGGRLPDSVHNYSLFNRATMSIRQPGSTFKGIDIMAAVRKGIGPDHVFLDAPYSIYLGRGKGRHWVRNYDGSFRGEMTLREIIAQSRNVPTLRMVDSLRDHRRPGHRGIDEVIAAARMLGITTPMDRYISTALGSMGVIPLEFANAYRAIASGIFAEPYVVRNITDEKGNIIAEHHVQTRPLPVSPIELRTVQELLRGTIRLPRGTGRAMNAIPVPCAGKTGTTNDHKDVWFVCFTYGVDGITVLAWVGYDEFQRPLPAKGYARKATGGSVALPIVREIMLNAYGENSPLGEPPRFPREIESSIDQYIYWYYTFPQMIQ